MRPAPAAVLLLPFLFSGCIFDHCGPSSDASWVEPALFDHIGAQGAAITNPEPGIPFDAALLNASWGPVTLQRIEAPSIESQTINETDFDRGHHWRATISVALWAPGADRYAGADSGSAQATRPFVTVDGFEMPRDELDAAARTMLDAVGLNVSEEWFDGLAAQRDEYGRQAYRGGLERVMYRYWHEVPDTPDVAGLVQTLGADNATRESRVYVQDVAVVWPNGWRMSFDAAVAEATLDGTPPLQLQVNAADGVHVEMPDEHDGNETSGREWVVATLRSNGLGTPAVDAWDWQTTIC